MVVGASSSSASSSGHGQPKRSLLDPETSGTPSKKSRTHSLDSIVAKCLIDNFKGASTEVTDIRLHEGLTLRQRLLQDKNKVMKKASDAPTMGSVYYRELKGFYMNINTHEALKPRDGEEVSARLMKAMVQAWGLGWE